MHNFVYFSDFLGLAPGFVSWVLGIVSWVLGLVFWVLALVFWVLGLVFWLLGLVFWVLGLVFWVLGLVFWMPQQSLHSPGCQTEIAEQSRQPSQETKILNIFLQFFGPGTSPRGFASPRRSISCQKSTIWMRLCRDIAVFVVLVLNFQAVIKSAASAASPKTKIQESRAIGRVNGSEC